MRVASLVKSPAETIVHAVDLGGLATALGPVEIAQRGLVAGASAIEAEAALTNGDVTVSISGGSDGEVYSVDVPATMQDAATRELSIELTVIDGDWTMPEGGAPMLSVAEFVSRVGRDQVLLLTDMGDGRIDKGLVISALIDAQAQAEANLAGRYALPFATVPTLLLSIISDLARANLYVDELPKNVDDKRKIALRNLEALRKGDLRLGVEAKAQTKAPSDPVRFNSGTLAYPDGLKDYSFR